MDRLSLQGQPCSTVSASSNERESSKQENHLVLKEANDSSLKGVTQSSLKARGSEMASQSQGEGSSNNSLQDISSGVDSWMPHLKATFSKIVSSPFGAPNNKELEDQWKMREVAELAKSHGCHLVNHFQQQYYLSDKLQKQHPNFIHDIKVDQKVVNGSCLGLSIQWLRHHLSPPVTSGKDFFQRLDDLTGDPLMKDALQTQCQQMAGGAWGLLDSRDMLKHLLPPLNMGVAQTKDGESAHFFVKASSTLGKTLDRILSSGEKKSCLILTIGHAIALHHHENGTLEFFDPDYGVIKADNRHKMIACINDIMERDKDRLFGPPVPIINIRPRPLAQLVELTMV